MSRTAHHRQLENVYLGVVLIQAAFPDVRKVRKKILDLFIDIDAKVSIREIRHFVENFRNVQYGCVESRNVPEEMLKSLKVDKKAWKDRPEGDFIEIRS